MVIVRGHLRISQLFVVAPAPFTGGGEFFGGVQRTVQNVNLSVCRQQWDERLKKVREIRKVLDCACDNDDIEETVAEGCAKDVRNDPAQIPLICKYSIRLRKFGSVPVQADDATFHVACDSVGKPSVAAPEFQYIEMSRSSCQISDQP